MRFAILQVFLFCTGFAQAQQYVISTIAGGAALPTPVSAVSASVGDPPRMAQGFSHLTKAGQEPEAGVRFGDLVEAGAQQWRPAVEIAGLDEYNSF